MVAATKQQPTTAHRTFMTTLQLGQPITKEMTAGILATSDYSSLALILPAIRFRPEPVS